VMACREMPVRMWRIGAPENGGSGALMWFDPDLEVPMLREMDPSEAARVDAFSERDDQSCLHPKKSAQLSLLLGG